MSLQKSFGFFNAFAGAGTVSTAIVGGGGAILEGIGFTLYPSPGGPFGVVVSVIDVVPAVTLYQGSSQNNATAATITEMFNMRIPTSYGGLTLTVQAFGGPISVSVIVLYSVP